MLARQRSMGQSVRPIPAPANRAISILVSFSMLYIVLSFFSSENIFTLTQSRLQIPTDVLFTRLSALRPNHVLTPLDDALHQKLSSRDSRLLYFQYGPDVIANCPFCKADEPETYFQYALPTLLAPHLFNAGVLLLSTSDWITKGEGNRWRTTAIVLASAIAIIDLMAVKTYDYQSNTRATTAGAISAFHWTMSTARLFSLVAINLVLCLGLYLSSTNRFFAAPTNAQRIERSIQILEAAREKMGAASLTKNAVVRDQTLRGVESRYWWREVQITAEAMEDKEVVRAVNSALQQRVPIDRVTALAEGTTNGLLRDLRPANDRGQRGVPGGSAQGAVEESRKDR